MLGFTLRFARRAVNQLCGPGDGAARRLRVQAVLAGAGLGTLVHALAAAADAAGESRFRLAMALVTVAAGGLSFVLYAQQAPGGRSSSSSGPVECLAGARACASRLGCGLVATLHALDALQRLTG